MRFLAQFLALLVLLMATSHSRAGQLLYLSAGGKICVFEIEAASGKLTPFQQFYLPGAGPLAVSPDKRKLYAVAQVLGKNIQPSPAVATFAVDESGRLKQLQIAEINLRPSYLQVDATGAALAGSHYGPGKASLWKLKEGIYEGETIQELELEKNAHSTVFSPSNRWLLVPATGPNKVFVNRFDAADGKAIPHDPPFASGPAGEQEARQPRHLIFHPKLKIAYTTLERLRPGVGVWNWDDEAGKLECIQNIVTQPEGFAEEITTAELHLTPDARFLYISNRDSGRPGSQEGVDTLVAFAVAADSGKLTMLGHYPCEHIPRALDMDETGRFLYVAGQNDNRLGLYAIEEKTGALKKIQQYETDAGPIWVHCMTPPGS